MKLKTVSEMEREITRFKIYSILSFCFTLSYGLYQHSELNYYKRVNALICEQNEKITKLLNKESRLISILNNSPKDTFKQIQNLECK